MIITEEAQLRVLCEEVKTVKEGEEIGAQLLIELSKSENGIGLAANQIGINKRVCVVNVKEPLVLVNPTIIERSKEEFIFPEGCLSFPDQHVRAKRNVSITVEADNHKDKMVFTAESEDVNDAFECACIQHEIDHTLGITMFDREYKQQPIKSNKTYGRNQKITISDGSETKTIKYKKATSLLENGWEIIDES